MTKVFVDRFGNQIYIGDVIVYANSAGRSAKTAVGLVVDIKPTDPNSSSYSWCKEKLIVVSLQSDCDRWRDMYASKVTLSVSERILKYSKEFISPEGWDVIIKHPAALAYIKS